MAERHQGELQAGAAVRITNPEGHSPIVLVCEHASNHIPEKLRTLGLSKRDLQRHIAFDPGALPVAHLLSASLDAVLVHATVSRLVVDCNRPLDAPDLITQRTETTDIPGNIGISGAERAERIALSWEPFHWTLETLLDTRTEKRRETAIVSIHSYNPTWKGVARPWHAGIIHDDDERMARPIIDRLRADPGLVIGDNEPYAPADRVYYTLERHARSRGLPCAMIEIRNDEIAETSGQRRWTDRFAAILSDPQVTGFASGKRTGGVKPGEHNMSHRRVPA